MVDTQNHSCCCWDHLYTHIESKTYEQSESWHHNLHGKTQWPLFLLLTHCVVGTAVSVVPCSHQDRLQPCIRESCCRALVIVILLPSLLNCTLM